MTIMIDRNDENAMTMSGNLFTAGRKKVFLAVFVSVSTIVFFSYFGGGDRTFRSEVSVLAIPGSDASLSPDEIAESVVFLSGTEGFRSALFSDMGSVPGLVTRIVPERLSDEEGRDVFGNMLSVSRSRTDGIFSMTASADDPDDAALISRIAALSLFRYVSGYYDIRRQADFRIVDGPSTETSASGAVFAAMVGIGAGALSVILSVLFVSVTDRMFRLRSETVRTKPFAAEMFQPKRPVSTILSEPVEDDDFPETPSDDAGTVISVPMKQAPAPADVPSFSDEEERFLSEFSFEDPTAGDDDAEADPDATPVEPSELETVSDEPLSPTDEEYRRRLNELLRG